VENDASKLICKYIHTEHTTEATRQILEYTGDINAGDGIMLFNAVRYQLYDVAILLIQKGADINADRCRSLLFTAI
jgi:hypothetical protein